MTTKQGWEEVLYRKYEKMLSDFKNGKVTYSDFLESIKIDRASALAEQKKQIKEAIENVRMFEGDSLDMKYEILSLPLLLSTKDEKK